MRGALALDHSADGRSTLQQCEDPHALLAYLLSSDPRACDRSQELRKALADFAMHQIALLSAVVEGARSMLEQLGPKTLRDQRENRMVPVEISVVNIGYRMQGEYYHNLPPRPPMSRCRS